MGAGPFEMRCVDPFRRWTAYYSGEALDTTVDDQWNGTVDRSRTVDVDLHIEMRDGGAAVDPGHDGRRRQGDDERRLHRGGVHGRVALRAALPGHGIVPRGLRCRGGFSVHRAADLPPGRARHRGFWGHCWQSALFPSGKAFGYIAYPPETGGPPTYAECYLYEGDGELIPAKLVDARWMTEFVAHGGEVPCAFESALGTTKIDGETFLSVIHRGMPQMPGLALHRAARSTAGTARSPTG